MKVGGGGGGGGGLGLERDCNLKDVAAEIETERLENVEITRV